MKYLCFDVFASFSPQMAASSVTDMLKSEDEFKDFAENLGAILSFSEIKRHGMEALYTHFSFDNEDEMIGYDSLLAFCGNAKVADNAKEKLISFLNILSEAKAFDICDAKFLKAEILPEIISSAYVFKKLNDLKVNTIYLPRLFSSENTNFLNYGYECSNSDETSYILKKYGIKTISADFKGQTLTPCGASFLAVCNPLFSAPDPSFTIKVGYGAGDEIENVSNVLRTVYGEENEDATEFSMSMEFEEIFSGAEV